MYPTRFFVENKRSPIGRKFAQSGHPAGPEPGPIVPEDYATLTGLLNYLAATCDYFSDGYFNCSMF
jgi:hypothetical protein